MLFRVYVNTLQKSCMRKLGCISHTSNKSYQKNRVHVNIFLNGEENDEQVKGNQSSC